MTFDLNWLNALTPKFQVRSPIDPPNSTRTKVDPEMTSFASMLINICFKSSLVSGQFLERVISSITVEGLTRIGFTENNNIMNISTVLQNRKIGNVDRGSWRDMKLVQAIHSSCNART
jgi:hypothetical protein